MSPNQSTEAALNGIRVIDFSRIVAGPHCTMCLADFGADVIKVEDTGKGDDLRSHKPPHIKCDSPYFLSLNRNKRHLALDLAVRTTTEQPGRGQRASGAGRARVCARGGRP